MQNVFIGFGSNQGDSASICIEAIRLLRSNPKIEIQAISSFYRTEPQGFEDQPWFINGVIVCTTDLEPEELLEFLLNVENHLGRVRELRWGPRTLDLDILSYGDRIVDLANLAIPHPRLHERRFVLVPLMEIAPDWRHPVLRVPAETLLEGLGREAAGDVIRLDMP